MACDRLSDDQFDAYVAGQLTDAAMADVETHAFGCEECFTRIEVMTLARQSLRRPVPRRRLPPFIGLAAALVAAFGFGAALWWMQRGPHDSSAGRRDQTASASERPAGPAASSVRPIETPATGSSVPAGRQPAGAVDEGPRQAVARAPVEPVTRDAALRQLARFEVPPLFALVVRGPADAARAPALDAALLAYGRHDFAEAVRLFRELDLGGPDGETVAFYGGVSALELGQRDTARDWLTRATHGSDPTCAVESWLYLAYLHLAAGDVDAARNALDRYLDLEGDQVARARELRAGLNRLPPR